MAQGSLLDRLKNKAAGSGAPAPVSESTGGVPKVEETPSGTTTFNESWKNATDSSDPPPPAINPPESKEPGPTKEEVKAEAPAPAPAPKKRGRPKKDEPAAPAADAAPNPDEPIPYSVTEPIVIYVDAYPVGRSARFIDRLIEEAKAKVASECKNEDGSAVADYRFLPYGQGPGALAVAFFSLFDKEPPGSWIASSATLETSIVIAGLVARADHIIRGMR